MGKNKQKVPQFNVTVFNIEVRLPTGEVAVSEPIEGFEKVDEILKKMLQKQDESGRKIHRMGDITVVEL